MQVTYIQTAGDTKSLVTGLEILHSPQSLVYSGDGVLVPAPLPQLNQHLEDKVINT